jgi:hypothetical protein
MEIVGKGISIKHRFFLRLNMDSRVMAGYSHITSQ